MEGCGREVEGRVGETGRGEERYLEDEEEDLEWEACGEERFRGNEEGKEREGDVIEGEGRERKSGHDTGGGGGGAAGNCNFDSEAGEEATTAAATASTTADAASEDAKMGAAQPAALPATPSAATTTAAKAIPSALAPSAIPSAAKLAIPSATVWGNNNWQHHHQ